eukprot:360150-Pelagomonas_calceolata.AAC.8
MYKRIENKESACTSFNPSFTSLALPPNLGAASTQAAGYRRQAYASALHGHGQTCTWRRGEMERMVMLVFRTTACLVAPVISLAQLPPSAVAFSTRGF